MNKTTGQKLKEAREARNLSLEDVSKETHMRLHYLQALEEDDYEAMPSATQARGFLRTYARYLVLDADPLLVEADEKPVEEPTEQDSSPEETEPEPTPAADQGKTAEATFVEVGNKLRKQREVLGLSLLDVEHHTSLKVHYLEALETGDIDSLPSPVQGRGMLNNYAIFLGMDPDDVLIPFAEGLKIRLSNRQSDPNRARPQGRRRTTVPRPVRKVLSNDLIIGGALIIFLVGFALWGAIRIFAMQSDDSPEPTAPSIVDVLLASPTPSPTVIRPTETPTQSGVILVNPDEGPDSEATAELPIIISGQEDIEIYLSILTRTWVQVTVDGEIELSGRVLPGSAYSFFGEEIVEILTGNGRAIQVFYNGNDEGRMGEYGEVVLWIYSREGFITPTPTITPIVTETPRVTPTSQPLPDVGTSIAPSP